MTFETILAWVRERATDLQDAAELAKGQGLPPRAVHSATVEERITTCLSTHVHPSPQAWDLAWTARTRPAKKDDGTVLADLTWSVGCEQRKDPEYAPIANDSVAGIQTRHSEPVRAFVQRKVSGATSEIAEDAWYSTIESAFRSYWRLKPTKRYLGKARLRTLLNTIARRKAIVLVNERVKQSEQESPIEPGISLPVEDALDSEELIANARSCMEAMPEERRKIASLHWIEGKSPSEIAVLLGKSRPNVSNQLSKAKLSLRASMGARAIDA